MSKADDTTNRRKFTIGVVRGFNCPVDKSEAKLWDTDVKSLIIRARPSGTKAYFFQGRLNNKMIRIKIGDVTANGITIEDARNQALEYQKLVSSKLDPRLEIKRTIEREGTEHREIIKNSVHYWEVQRDYIEAFKDDWGDSHLNDYLRSLEPTTRGRDGILIQYKNTKLCEITSAKVLTWLREEKKHRPTAAAKGYRLLRACLKWANGQEKYRDTVDLEQLFNNTEIRKVLPKPKARTDALLKSQLETWFDAVRSINNPVIAASLQAMLLTGARREEILSLRWVDVEFQWLSLRIKDKVEGERIIPLTPYVAQLLNNLPRRNKWVFSSEQSASGRLTEPYIAHKAALISAELPPISLHGLRRSFGSLSEWVECPVGVVAQIQGHKPSATAEKHYRVRPLDLLQMWHNKIEKQVLEFGGIEQPEELRKGIRVVC